MTNSFEKLAKHAKHLKVDGLPHIVRCIHPLSAILWTVLLIGNAGVCVWLIITSCHHYNDHMVSTTVRVYHERESVFPTITLCNMNPLSNQKASIYLANLDKETFRRLLNSAGSYGIVQYVQSAALNRTGSFLSESEIQRMSQLEEMLVSCDYNGVKCAASDFEYIYNVYYINCYRFNGNGSIFADNLGKKTSLKMQLYAGLADKILYNQKGFFVFLGNATLFPGSYSNAKFSLTPGVGFSLVPERAFYNQYKSPYSGCTVKEDKTLTEPLEDPSVFNNFLNISYTYNQADCMTMCKFTHILDVCNCNATKFNCLKLSAELYCNNDFSKIQCTIREGDKMNKGGMEQICLPKCPLECDQYTFSTISVSSYRFPTEKYATDEQTTSTIRKTLPRSTDLTNLSMNLVEFSVYYDSLSYMKIEEEPKMSVDDLIAIIGGHLHVFLGMSLLSFVELFEIIVLVALVIVCKRKKDTKVHEDDAAIQVESVESETNITQQPYTNQTDWSTNSSQRPVANKTDWS